MPLKQLTKRPIPSFSSDPAQCLKWFGMINEDVGPDGRNGIITCGIIEIEKPTTKLGVSDIFDG